jgi:UDP-3-O-[3-hydroxymyristoyl] glucosamine N-acyltransferase
MASTSSGLTLLLLPPNVVGQLFVSRSIIAAADEGMGAVVLVVNGEVEVIKVWDVGARTFVVVGAYVGVGVCVVVGACRVVGTFVVVGACVVLRAGSSVYFGSSIVNGFCQLL